MKSLEGETPPEYGHVRSPNEDGGAQPSPTLQQEHVTTYNPIISHGPTVIATGHSAALPSKLLPDKWPRAGSRSTPHLPALAVEDDPAVHSVGFGGIGNSIGTVSLDACVMDGKTLDCGSVAGVENIRHVAALAKKVYEKTPHVMLVGKGAEWFAIQNGFPLETLLTPESVAAWEKDRPKKKVDPKGHDTVTVIANDGRGHLGGVCTTSGLSYKMPGRVGDSPLIGAASR